MQYVVLGWLGKYYLGHDVFSSDEPDPRPPAVRAYEAVRFMRDLGLSCDIIEDDGDAKRKLPFSGLERLARQLGPQRTI